MWTVASLQNGDGGPVGLLPPRKPAMAFGTPERPPASGAAAAQGPAGFDLQGPLRVQAIK